MSSSSFGAQRLLQRPVLGLALITFLALLIHGYHLGVDDAAIYVPAIKRAADPGLYPFGSEFFMSHAQWSFFADLVGDSSRITRLPVDLVIFLWHVGSIFLLLLASWRLLGACFQNEFARWSGVALVAGVLSIPVAGTALMIMDPYITARSLSTPATIFAVACCLSGKQKQAAFWLLATLLIHPQMGVYGGAFLGCLSLARQFQRHAARVPAYEGAAAAALPFAFEFQPAHGAAREALLSRSYFFVFTWTWYEWLGVVAPLALLWWLSKVSPKGTTPAFRILARTLVPFGLLATAAAIIFSSSARLENFTRLQPMRSFHLVYVVFFALLGGLIGEYALRRSMWRWLGLFLPLAASMWLLQRSSYPSSPHVEWPGCADQNTWVRTFDWIRDHTPKDAVFALDPDYMARPGEDQHGFRAVAERSVLADEVKDSGAVSLFPRLADRWKRQVQAQTGWASFRLEDFTKLARRYPVTWILTRRPALPGLVCPYQNRELAVCRIAGSPTVARGGH